MPEVVLTFSCPLLLLQILVRWIYHGVFSLKSNADTLMNLASILSRQRKFQHFFLKTPNISAISSSRMSVKVLKYCHSSSRVRMCIGSFSIGKLLDLPVLVKLRL